MIWPSPFKYALMLAIWPQYVIIWAHDDVNDDEEWKACERLATQSMGKNKKRNENNSKNGWFKKDSRRRKFDDAETMTQS